MIEINFFVMPDPVSGTGQARSGIQKPQKAYFLDSPVNPSTILRAVSMSNGPGNDKSLRDNKKLASPKGDVFIPSPIGTLIWR